MKVRLLIATDLGLLKAYKIESREAGSPRITLLEELMLEPAHQHMTDQITDSAGRRAAPGARRGGATLTDAHNLELENKRRLVRKLVDKIETLIGTHAPEGCWLAAQKEILRPVTESLRQDARALIEKAVALDLTKLDPRQVLEHFQAPAR